MINRIDSSALPNPNTVLGSAPMRKQRGYPIGFAHKSEETNARCNYCLPSHNVPAAINHSPEQPEDRFLWDKRKETGFPPKMRFPFRCPFSLPPKRDCGFENQVALPRKMKNPLKVSASHSRIKKKAELLRALHNA